MIKTLLIPLLTLPTLALAFTKFSDNYVHISELDPHYQCSVNLSKVNRERQRGPIRIKCVVDGEEYVWKAHLMGRVNRGN